MRNSLVVMLSIFFISSCSAKPEEETVSHKEIIAFASMIETAGLFIAIDSDLIAFEIAPDGTYTDAKNILYTITHFINENTVTATSVDYGKQTHILTNGSYGAVFQEIAFTPAAPSATLDFRTKVNAKLLDSEQNGSWQTFEIPENGKYTTDNVTYTIVRLIDTDSALVAKSTGGSEMHKLVDDEYGVFTGPTVTKDIAFKKATLTDVSAFTLALTDFVFAIPSSGAWVSLDATGTTYKLDSVTYEIGKVIDATSVLVAKSPSGTEIHKIVDNKSLTKGGAELAFKRATDDEIGIFFEKLRGFLDSTEWSPPTFAVTIYIFNDKIYEIGKIIDANSVLVASPSGVETHTISPDGKSLTKFGGAEIAFKRATEDDILDFVYNTLADFRSATDGRWKGITSSFTTYTLQGVKYHIYKIKDNTATIVKDGTSPTFFENRKEHLIIDGTNYADKTTPTIPLAIRRNNTTDKDNIESFAQRITALNLTRKDPTTSVTTSFLIADDGQYTHADYDMEIGRIINDTTILMVTEPPGGGDTYTQVQGLRNGKFGRILGNTVDPDNIIAEDTRLADLKVALAGFVYSTGTALEDFPNAIIPGSTSDIIGKYVIKKYSGGGTGGQTGTTTYNIIAFDKSTKKVTVNNSATGMPETHEIKDYQYGKADSGTIPFGTEIAVKPTSPADIKTYADLLRAKNLIFPYDNNTWNDLEISDDGEINWWASGQPFKIIRIVTPTDVNSKVLVSSAGLGQEVHQFEDPVYFNYQPPNNTTKRHDLAYVGITPDQLNNFIAKVNDLGLIGKNSVDPFEINLTGTYTHAGKTYKIGRYIDENTIYVSLGKNRMEKHGIKTDSTSDIQYGILNDDSTMKTVIAK